MKKEAPSLIFLNETKLFSHAMEKVKHRPGMHGVCVESNGHAGGMWLLWAKDLMVDLCKLGQQFIDVRVHGEDDVLIGD